MSVPKLTYFDIAGAAEPIRLAFTLNDAEFEDERLDRAAWGERKASTPFGQLPLLTIGDKVFAQSMGILAFAGQSGTGACYPCSDPLKKLEIDQAVGVVVDVANAWNPCLYMGWKPSQFGLAEDFAQTDAGKAQIKQARENFVAIELPKFMQQLTKLISDKGNGFLCGPDPTIADCLLYPRLKSFQAGFIDNVPTDCLDKYPDIIAYVARMQSHPKIKAWEDAHQKK